MARFKQRAWVGGNPVFGFRRTRGTDGVSLREDSMIEDLRMAIKEVLSFSDAVIVKATEYAKEQVALYEDHSVRIKAELAEVRKRVSRLTDLLLDPDITKEAKPVISGQLGEAGKREAELQGMLVTMGDHSNREHGRLASKIQQALAMLTERLESVASGPELNRLVEDVIGPSRVTIQRCSA